MRSFFGALLGAGFLLLILSGCASSPGKKAGTGGTGPGGDTATGGSGPDTFQSGMPGPSTSKFGKHAKPSSTLPGSGPGAAGTSTAGKSAGSDSTAGKGTLAGAGKPSAEVVPAPSPAPPRSEPLIMENADRMEGYRLRGEYILSGKVRFSHGGLRLETERAVWLKDQSLIYAEAGMKISHHGAVLTSDRGSYDKNQGRATAEGKVRMRDSSGEMEALGNNVTYLRFKHLVTLTGDPEVRRYYRKTSDTGSQGDSANRSDSSANRSDSSAKRSASSANRSGPVAPSSRPSGPGSVGDTAAVIDTLVIRGKTLTYNDSAQVATADSDVRITRKKVVITCKKAEYHDRSDSLYLVGDPLVKVDESQVKGIVMRVGMNGEEIRSLLVKGDAQARTMEPATDTSSARQSDVKGDSLFLAFKEKAIDSVQVFRNTKGSYFDVDKPDFVNRMSGEYMVLRFNDKKIASANVMGGAKSTYFHLEKQALKGKNDAEGDTIDFAFKDGKVEEVMVRGRAKGTYFGEPQSNKPAAASPGPAPAPSDTSGPGIPPSSAAPARPPAPAEANRANLPNNPRRKQ